MTIGAAIVLIAIGAVMKWAVTAHVTGFDIQTAGTVVLIVGIVGLVLGVMYTFWWSRERYPRYDGYDPRRPPPGPPRARPPEY
jgi:predicted tellurium resistance membrane protein TerC